MVGQFDLGCGALEQDDFTLLQEKVEFMEWREFYILSMRDTGGWMTSLDIIILFRRSDGKTAEKGSGYAVICVLLFTQRSIGEACHKLWDI